MQKRETPLSLAARAAATTSSSASRSSDVDAGVAQMLGYMRALESLNPNLNRDNKGELNNKLLKATLISWADQPGLDVILVTGGTGFGRRDAAGDVHLTHGFEAHGLDIADGGEAFALAVAAGVGAVDGEVQLRRQ